MTELKISVRLDADGRAYVASIDAAGKATGEYKKVVTESGKAAKAAAAEAKTAARERAQAEKEAAAVAKAAAREAAAALREQQLATNKARIGYGQLGQQVQDFGVQIGSGTSVLRAFSQQIGQAAFVMQDAGGKAGAFAKFLVGPWGTALTLGLVAVDLLTSALGSNADAAEDARAGSSGLADAQSVLGEIFDTTTGKIKSQNELLRLNARLTAVKLRADAMKEGAGSRATFSNAGQRDPFAFSMERLLGGGRAMMDETRRARELSRIASDVQAGRKSAEAALKETQNFNFKGLKVSADDFRQALVDNLSSTAKTRTADLIDKSLDSNNLASEFRTGGGRGGSGAGGRRSGRGGSGGRISRVSADSEEASRATRELDAELSSLTRRFDAAATAADNYAQTLSSIRSLQGSGKLSDGDAALFGVKAAVEYRDTEEKRIQQETKNFYQTLGIDVEADFKEIVTQSTNRWESGLSDGAKTAGKELEEGSVTAAQAFSQVIGGNLGNTISQILGVIEGSQSGNYNSVGGRLGGLMTLFGGQAGADGKASGFAGGVSEFSADLKKTFKGIFGESGPFSGAMGKTLGKAFAGAQFGGAIGKGVTNALGIKGSKTGAQVGGAIGQAFGGPIGAAIGGTLGSIVGGLFKKTKTGSTSIGFADGGLALGSTTGNSQAFKDQSKGIAQSIMGNLTSLADQLGAVITGAPTVSVGIRKGKPVVDTTGRNRTKGAGVVTFGKGEEAQAAAFAQQEALKDLINDGFIQGLSAKVKAALQSDTDIEKAMREALKVDELERLLGGFGGAAKKAFVDFERQAKERLRIAGKYGFDLVKLEELNAKDRNKLFESAVESAVGSLKGLLEDLTTGERAPGTLLDRRDALIAKRDSLLATAATDADAANKLADVLNQLDQVNLEAFGTAGAQFASDRAGIKSTAQAIIEQATADLKAAQDKAMANAGTDATAKAIADANAGVISALDEGNDQRAQMIALLAKLAATGVATGGAGNALANLQLGLNLK